MIKLHFNNTMARNAAHQRFQFVAEDVLMFHRMLNQKNGKDENLPCPSSEVDEASGIANSSELWFGKDINGSVFDLNVRDKKTLELYAHDTRLRMLFQLTCLSLCEQFVYTKFETDENFNAAVHLYEESVGSISKNACMSLGLKERK